jgi:succinyl-CoA synthetase beta subunit
VKGIFVNIFGGIMRCDTIATGIVEAVDGSGSRSRSWCAWKGPTSNSARRSSAVSGLDVIAPTT